MLFKHGIMLVEASPEAATQVLNAFKEAAISNPVTTFTTGEKAMAYLEDTLGKTDRVAHPLPCFILLNLHLNDMSGIAFLEWLRNHPKLRRMPVVAFGNPDDTELFVQAYDSGANSCLVKPVSAEELLRLIKSINGYWVILVEKPLL